MSAAAERISGYEIEYGTAEVERFLDAVMAIQEHVDPVIRKPYGLDRKHYIEAQQRREKKDRSANQLSSPYDDLWDLEKQDQANEESNEDPKRFPVSPEKDIVWFVQQFSPVLEDWQRDIMSIIREEMLYFWPQIETKIMNEGWASYWHQRIMRELPLTSEETVEYAKLNSAVVQPSKHSLNPYYLGLKIFEDIEKRFGREKIFEVRELDSDASFLRNYLTKELTEELDLYIFEKKGQEWKITDKGWENVRDQLVFSRVNGGFPYMEVTDADYQRSGELYVTHQYEGTELDLKYVERTLPYLVALWGKNVHLETFCDDKKVLFTCDGKRTNRRSV